MNKWFVIRLLIIFIATMQMCLTVLFSPPQIQYSIIYYRLIILVIFGGFLSLLGLSTDYHKNVDEKWKTPSWKEYPFSFTDQPAQLFHFAGWLSVISSSSALFVGIFNKSGYIGPILEIFSFGFGFLIRTPYSLLSKLDIQ